MWYAKVTIDGSDFGEFAHREAKNEEYYFFPFWLLPLLGAYQHANTFQIEFSPLVGDLLGTKHRGYAIHAMARARASARP